MIRILCRSVLPVIAALGFFATSMAMPAGTATATDLPDWAACLFGNTPECSRGGGEGNTGPSGPGPSGGNDGGGEGEGEGEGEGDNGDDGEGHGDEGESDGGNTL